MSNGKQLTSIDWLEREIQKSLIAAQKDYFKWAFEQAKAMHKEEVKNSYISGYLDNGYYEGAEEDASKLWEDTYGFSHNETFGGNNE